MSTFYFSDAILFDLISGIHCEQCSGDAYIFYDYPRVAFEEIKNITETDCVFSLFDAGLSDYDFLEYYAFLDEFLHTNWVKLWVNYHEED